MLDAMRNWFYVFVVLFLPGVNPLIAQENNLPYIDFSGSGQLVLPLGGFRDEMPRTGYGFGASLLVQIRPQPLLAGVEVGGQWLDKAKVEYSDFVDGEQRDYKLTSRSNIFLGHALLRYQPVIGSAVWPYIDGLFGISHFYTRTTLVEKQNDLSQTFIEGDIDKKDTSLSFGLGIGVQVRPFGHPAVRLDLRCRYLTGPNATYLVRDQSLPGPFDDPIEAFREVNTPTTMLLPQIGVTVDLSRLFEEIGEEEGGY